MSNRHLCNQKWSFSVTANRKSGLCTHTNMWWGNYKWMGSPWKCTGVFFLIFYNKTKVKLNLQSFHMGRTWLRTNTINLLHMRLHFQTGPFWKCSGFSRAGFGAGVCYPDGHRPGHRVPRLPSGDPLGSVFVDASPGAGGSCCCWAHQRGFHRWVMCLAYRCPFVNEGIPTILRKGFQPSDHNQISYIVQVWKKPTYLENLFA